MAKEKSSVVDKMTRKLVRRTYFSRWIWRVAFSLINTTREGGVGKNFIEILRSWVTRDCHGNGQSDTIKGHKNKSFETGKKEDRKKKQKILWRQFSVRLYYFFPQSSYAHTCVYICALESPRLWWKSEKLLLLELVAHKIVTLRCSWTRVKLYTQRKQDRAREKWEAGKKYERVCTYAPGEPPTQP